MASPEDTTILELPTAEKLDDEITKLRAQVDSLKRDLQLHTTTLLTAEPIQQAITTPNDNNDNNDLAAHAARQQAHKQQCLYRACASVTTFRVRDPDPAAVDGGRVLGLRFEVMARARFARPYFVLLNRPWTTTTTSAARNRNNSDQSGDYLRVHRHTVPACVPLAGLAARYLPPPPSRRAAAAAEDEDGDDDGGDDDDDRARRRRQQRRKHRQDLPAFVRTLRRELVRYHNRVGVIGDLRKAAGLEASSKRRRSSSSANTTINNMMDPPIVDVSAADAEAKQIRVEWGDGKSGRLVMGDDGEILKMVVVRGLDGEQGQDRETMRRFLGGAVRIEEIVRGHF
ncbi:hypothetical protein SLS62_000043 [Diatrype stigma]|uniref:Cenp-O kinetochore centromere component n=1 Tax=Diatrype stigma TaxID=117547 RepID=A0AAN9V1T2_9PEZI